jgi:hypothetical protein
MAIATLDQALAGMQPTWPFAKATTPTLVAGRPHSLWYLAGAPGAGQTPPTTNGSGLLSSSSLYANNIAGQLPHQDPASGVSYLGRLTAMATQPGMLLLCDRLEHVGAIAGGGAISVTTTTAQTITSPTLPARDNNAATAGAGVMCGLEIITPTGAGAATPSIGYTNSAGAASKTASLIDTYVASSATGAFYRFGLQAGDIGISQINTLTLGVSMTSGTIALVLYRMLAAIELVGANIPNAIDALTGGFPFIPNGAVPFLIFIPNTTTASFICGTYTETQG